MSRKFSREFKAFASACTRVHKLTLKFVAGEAFKLKNYYSANEAMWAARKRRDKGKIVR